MEISRLQPQSPTKTRCSSQYGGAILEYLLVTAFAAVMGIAALTFVGKIVKGQLGKMGQKMGIEEPTDFSLPWGESP